MLNPQEYNLAPIMPVIIGDTLPFIIACFWRQTFQIFVNLFLFDS